jgi:adenine-specific DNA-methyltransferase
VETKEGFFPIEKKDGCKIKPNSTDGVWRWIYEKYITEKNKGNIEFKKTTNGVLVNENGKPSKWNIYTKIWLNDRQEEGQTPVDLITKYENRHSAKELLALNIPFDFSKPTDLIKYLIYITQQGKDSVVLDFFAGSSTTAHAVMQLNAEDCGMRKFIMVQLPEPTDSKSEAYKAGYKTICEIGKERIRRAGEKIVQENKDKQGIENLDIGFKVFKLDSSNIKKWDANADNLEINMDNMIDNFVPDRTEEDIVYEIMLKYGIDLTYPVEMRKIEDKKVFSIGFGALFICLDDDITLEVVEGIVKFKDELKPEITRIVFKDNGFKNDSVKAFAIYSGYPSYCNY